MTDPMFFEYRGVPVHQNGYVADVFRALFRTFKPVKVLEIGTADGGLTMTPPLLDTRRQKTIGTGSPIL